MNIKTRTSLLEYLGILVGCFIVALGFVLFINPYKFVPGGVFGTSIVLHHLFPSLQVGTFGYILEVPILLASVFCLGKRLGVRTLVASFAAPFMMNMLSSAFYPTQEALQALDPSQLLGGRLDLTHDKILAVILGPVLMGVGSGIMVRCKASTGGSDVIAMIISRYARVKFSNALMCVDGFVVFMGLLVIGIGWGTGDDTTPQNWVLSGYSLICIYVATRTLGLVISGFKNDKIMFVVADRETERLRHFILHDLDRTATCLPSHGLYSGQEKVVLMMVVRRKEVDYMTTRIKNFCPEVFIAVTDAYDTYGTRWSDLPNEGDLVLK